MASKLDQLSGRNGSDEEIDSLRKIAPSFCVNCQNYTNKGDDTCRVCKRILDPQEEIKHAKMDQIAYESAKELYRISPKKFEEIAESFGVRIENH